jgi:hypothetical protein
MSVEGLSFRWRDEGTIGGSPIALTAGDPLPAVPYSQTVGPFAIEVEAGATVTLWSAAASPLTAFDFLYVMAGPEPSVDGLADDGTTPDLAGELTLTTGGTAKTWIEVLRAGLPYRRFSNVAYDGDDAAAVVTSLSYENDTDDDVTVRVLLARA